MFPHNSQTALRNRRWALPEHSKWSKGWQAGVASMKLLSQLHCRVN